MPEALLAAPVILALVLGVGGALKLRDDDAATALEWDAMNVPARLNRRWARHAHPWGEIALAVALLVLPGVLGIIASGASLLLCLVYTALVIGAMRSPGAVCSCFGASHETALTGWTVARNLLLVLLAALGHARAIHERTAVVAAAAHSGSALAWILAVLLGMATVLLVAAPPTAGTTADAEGAVDADAVSGEPAPASAQGAAPSQEAEEDYVRTLTPAALLKGADGAVIDLLSITRSRAHPLLFLSPGCGHCETVAAHAHEWAEQMPQLAVRIVVSGRPETLEDRKPEWMDLALFDEDGTAARMLRATGTPTAVLLGTDGMLAGGPVSGSGKVIGLVDDIKAELGIA